MENIFWIEKSINIDDDIICGIIPVFEESMIIIIVREKKNNNTFELFINDKWYSANLITKEKNIPHNYTVIHKCKVSFDVFIKLKKEKKIDIKIKIPNTTHLITSTITYNKIMDDKENFLLIESLNHIFFCKKNIKQILSNIIPWIEYNLTIGVDQIIINQSQYLTDKDKKANELWIKLLYPYLKSKKVFLIMYKDNISEYSHQTQISNIAFYLNKHRTKWFATHDIDEYICPLNGAWESNNNERLTTYLKNIPRNINYIETKMYKVIIPKNDIYISAPTLTATHPMSCYHKFIVRSNDANILWVHYISNWKNKMQNDSKNTLRINHYKKNREDNKLIFYNGLENEYEIVKNNIEKKFNFMYPLIIGDVLNYLNRIF